MMQSSQGGNSGDPRGIEMESEMMMNEHPYRSCLGDEERIDDESCERKNGFQL
jgi:hypothetical protein